MPRCRKSYRGSRSKAQVPGLSSFPLPIRSLHRSFISFLPVRLLDRSTDRSENFILSSGVYARVAYVFSRHRAGTRFPLDVSTCVCAAVVVVADATASPWCANVSEFKPFISGKKFRERSNTADDCQP